MAEVFQTPAKCLPIMQKASQEYDWVYLPYLAYGAFGAWEFGGELKWPQSEFDFVPSVTRYPVSTPVLCSLST